jgi:hypothetical protein
VIVKSKASNRKNTVWPTERQNLLLRASLLKGRAALEAWEVWKSVEDVENLEAGSFRLLPLLYRNLKRLNVVHPHMDIFRGVYRKTWYQNQMLFHETGPLLKSFQSAGTAVMVLKGVALTELYYRDRGIRPMNDIDILVHEGDALKAVQLLRELGWHPIDFIPDEKYISVGFSHGFRNKAGRECDLHWHVLSQGRDISADELFWKGAETAEIEGAFCYVMNASDLLLHVCIHGARWNLIPTIRWVADAAVILYARHRSIDWDRLGFHARRLRLTLPLFETFNYLTANFTMPVEEHLLQSLHVHRVPLIERLEHRVVTRPPTPWTSFPGSVVPAFEADGGGFDHPESTLLPEVPAEHMGCGTMGTAVEGG